MKMSRANLEELFRTCDSKGSGFVGPDEFRELCTKFGISEADSNVIFADLDHDGDGKVDFEDFSYGFRDFLTPGSRRGSLQLPDNTISNKVLREMEKKHATAKNAWRHFTNNIGTTNIQPFLGTGNENLKSIVEELRQEDSMVSTKLETALSSLVSDVQTLHEEYKSLENSFKKEREIHAAQLAALGEEMDHQLAKTEAKVKAEARVEAQKQMDSERKKIAQEMEAQMSDLSSQMRTFQKVEAWLTEEETREKRGSRSSDEILRLQEAESENRKLKSALVESQMRATLLQTHLAEKRNEYLDLYNELHSEKVVATEYKNQCDLMQNHLSILSEANRVLSDANDCFSNVSLSSSPGPLNLAQEMGRMSKSNSLERSCQLKSSLDMFINDGDSGRETLFEELRSQGDGSPLPSGRWSVSPVTTEASSPDHLDVPMQPSSLELSPKASPRRFLDMPPPKHTTSNGFPQRTFKVILAGDAAVGKTTFIERVCNGYFVSNLSSTIGVDFRVKAIELDGDCVALQLWDTAGQERFRSLTKSYFRRADGVILMYDVTNERTFVSIRHWIQNVEEGAGRKVPIVLCGNKIDMRDELYRGAACVSTEDGKKLARQCGALFAETSPKTGHNVTNVLTLLAREMSLMEDAELKSFVQLNKEDEDKTVKKKGCCSGNSSNNSTSSPQPKSNANSNDNLNNKNN